MLGLRILLPLLILLSSAVQPSESCEFLSPDEEQKLELRESLDDGNVRLVEYDIQVDGYSEDFWRDVGGNEWFQPWRMYRVKGRYSERLLLLFHYYFGFLKPYMSIGVHNLDLHLTLSVPGCLTGLSLLELETKLRQFLYYDLKNETERLATEITDDIRVCSMHVTEYSGWGRLVYRCCYLDNIGQEFCSDVSDDEWVWVLRAFILIISILLFLYFPKLIPKGYYVYPFQYYPPDGQSFNLLVTANPAKYQPTSPDSGSKNVVLKADRWRKLRKFAGDISKLQKDVIHTAKIKCVTFECGMDRLLSETSSPVGVFRSLFDSWIRCKVRHADSLEDCCTAPLCGQLCCPSCPPWHTWLCALRTILLMLILAVPALPLLYVLAADNLEYQEVAEMMDDRGLRQSYNFYIGTILARLVVTVLAGLYVLHMILVVVDGCHDQNLSKAYTQLLQVTRHNARIGDRLRHSQRIIRGVFWPVKRFGVLAVPVGLILLLLLPVGLLAYMIFTSPVPKLLLHAVLFLCGKTTGRRQRTKAQMSMWDKVENVLFVITLVDVFGVLVLALNFLIHVLIVAIVQLIINIAFLMKFFTIIVLLVVYIRDAFRLVNNTYAAHHATVLGYVKAIEENDIREEANKDWREQENKIFKIVPSSAADSKGRTGKDQEEFQKKKLFLFKNDALRMRTRSLALFLDKDDIPYIPKKFLEHTTTILCPGSPGRLEEAYLRALGRFARTLVFLMLILLPLLAYASTYEVSNNLQFFAILFTGTIPLVMRYFFMSPGAILQVDTSAPRFVTQMDDKVESFMQSWVVEDVLVDHFRHPDEDDPDDLQDEPEGQVHKPGQPPSSPPRPASHRPSQVNYMIPEPILNAAENSHDLFGHQNYDLEIPPPDHAEAAEPNGPQRLPRAHKPQKKEKRKKKRKAKHMDDLLPETEEGTANAGLPALNGTHKERTASDKPKKKKGKKGPVRIDLILDISDDKMVTTPSRRLEEGEEERAVGGVTKLPNIHRNKRSRVVDENIARGEYDV